MAISRDYEDLFAVLNSYEIKFIVVGAHAVMFYAEPRFTKDIDVWIPVELNDGEKIYKALNAFGVPLSNCSPKTFENKKLIFQIGVAPVRIDLLFGLPGVKAEQAWPRCKKTLYGKTTVRILGIDDLISAKERAGRAQDRLDLIKLNKRRRGKKSRKR